MDVLARCFNEMARRHEILRTTFAGESSPGDASRASARQVIAPATCVPLPMVDLRGLAASRRWAAASDLAAREAVRPFDLARGGHLLHLGLSLVGD